MKIFYNGNIVTLKDEKDIHQAVVVEDGKIKFVGSDEEAMKLKDENTELVDLNGKTMLPGFIDPHSHYGNMSVFSRYTLIAPAPVGEVDSIQKMIEIMKKDYAKVEEKNKDKIFLAYGYDHEQLKEGRHPTRDDLDQISTETPIAISHASMHVGVFNSKAIELFGIDEEAENPEGGFYGRYEGSNKINGYVEEMCFQIPLMKNLQVAPEDLPEIIKAGQEIYAKSGVTTAQDGFTTNNEYGIFKYGVDNGLLDIDVHCYPPAIKQLQEGNHWIDGEFGLNFKDSIGENVHFSGYKMVLDGSPQARTAWMSKPYEVVDEHDDPNYVAYPFFEDDEVVTEGLVYAVERNAPVLVHCNGDATGDQFIRCFREALKRCDNEYTARAVMIHCQTVREDQIDEMAELNIVPAMFPIHTYFWGDVHMKNFGPERANKISNQKYALSKGLLPTSHEDSPVLPPNSILSVWSACNRKTRSGVILGEDLRLTRFEGLRTITYNAAWQYGEEDTKGTIEVGKLADLVICEKDLLHCSDDELFTATVDETIKKGKTIYKK